MEMLPDFLPTKEQTSVRNAAHLFAQRAFKHRYKWEPSEAILSQIAKMLFRS